MLKNFRILRPRLKLSLITFTLSAALTGCETVDTAAFDDLDCKELRAYSDLTSGSYGYYQTTADERLQIDQNQEEALDTLLNSSRNSPFKREAALRKAYKNKGC